MAMAEVTDIGVGTLAADRCAAPSFRLRDWATGGRVFVAGGLVSDRYRLAPVSAFDRPVAQLEDGAYEVPNLKAEPRLVGSAPEMARIARDALREATTPLVPVRLHGLQVLLEQPGDLAPAALFEASDGRQVALNADFVAGLTFESELEEGQALPPFFGRRAFVVRHRLLMHTHHAGDRAVAEHKPVVVERVAYGSGTHVREGRKTHVSGRWQCVIMPIRLG